MGTTVTPNLGLIKPDINESIRENLPISAGWPSQNGANCDKIDLLFRRTETTYTPLFTASGSSPAIGSTGTVQGKYVRHAGKLVTVFFRIVVSGTGISTGTGNYLLSLPSGLPVATEYIPVINSTPLGRTVFRDSVTPANSIIFGTSFDNTNVTNMIFILATGNFWAGTPSIAGGINLSGFATYITSAS